MEGGIAIRMIDLSQFQTVSELALFIMVAIQVVKLAVPLLDAHKVYIPLGAIVLGVILGPVIGLALGQVGTLQGLLEWFMGGFLAGAEAIGAYEATWDKVKRLPLFTQPEG